MCFDFFYAQKFGHFVSEPKKKKLFLFFFHLPFPILFQIIFFPNQARRNPLWKFISCPNACTRWQELIFLSRAQLLCIWVLDLTIEWSLREKERIFLFLKKNCFLVFFNGEFSFFLRIFWYFFLMIYLSRIFPNYFMWFYCLEFLFLRY